MLVGPRSWLNLGSWTSREEQCAYVDRQGCGGLPIPSVRRWDCLLETNYELTDSQRSLVDGRHFQVRRFGF